MLKTGKLDSDLLKKIVFENITYRRDEVITRPGIGEDCAEIDFGEYICTMSTDPITASVNDIGRLAIHISCNDIASNGIQPIGIMLAVMLPEGTTEEDVENIMKQASHAAEMMEVEIVGGHTEITPAVSRPVIVSTAVGRDVKSKEKFYFISKKGDAYGSKTDSTRCVDFVQTEQCLAEYDAKRTNCTGSVRQTRRRACQPSLLRSDTEQNPD